VRRSAAAQCAAVDSPGTLGVGRALGVDLADWGCGLNAAASEIVRQLLAQDPLPLLPKIEAALLASHIVQVPVEHSERAHGASTYTVRRLSGFAATFLRGFGIARSWRRVRTIAGFAAWTTLTGAALVTRAWHGLSSAPSEAPFRIREIRGPRGPEILKSSLGRALGDRPNDVVSGVR
jgi:hypothetical protein